MKKRALVPVLIAAAAGVFFLLAALSLPGIKFLGMDLRIAVIAVLGFFAFKIYGWSRSLFGEMPP